ncbi:MAG: shikimate kinase [Alistipes sp.]|nr:shikimate kinase [Alistipes sp.]
MKLFLVGYMGSGKSSSGRKAARLAGVRFWDTDSEVERAEGAAIADIFRYAGEEYFRQSERSVLEGIVAREGSAIVSVGGGLPLWGDNMDYLKGAGTTVYLRMSAECIAGRMSLYGRERRPLLRGLKDEELRDFIARGIEEREPCYMRAHRVIDVDGMQSDDVARRITDIFNGYGQ